MKTDTGQSEVKELLQLSLKYLGKEKKLGAVKRRKNA